MGSAQHWRSPFVLTFAWDGGSDLVLVFRQAAAKLRRIFRNASAPKRKLQKHRHEMEQVGLVFGNETCSPARGLRTSLQIDGERESLRVSSSKRALQGRETDNHIHW